MISQLLGKPYCFSSWTWQIELWGFFDSFLEGRPAAVGSKKPHVGWGKKRNRKKNSKTTSKTKRMTKVKTKRKMKRKTMEDKEEE